MHPIALLSRLDLLPFQLIFHLIVLSKDKCIIFFAKAIFEISSIRFSNSWSNLETMLYPLILSEYACIVLCNKKSPDCKKTLTKPHLDCWWKLVVYMLSILNFHQSHSVTSAIIKILFPLVYNNISQQK